MTKSELNDREDRHFFWRQSLPVEKAEDFTINYLKNPTIFKS